MEIETILRIIYALCEETKECISYQDVNKDLNELLTKIKNR